MVYKPCHFLFKFQAFTKDSHKYKTIFKIQKLRSSSWPPKLDRAQISEATLSQLFLVSGHEQQGLKSSAKSQLNRHLTEKMYFGVVISI